MYQSRDGVDGGVKIAGTKEAAEARRLFEEEWGRRHPGTPPPALHPERPEDSMWQEANQLMDSVWAQASVRIGLSDDHQTYLSGPKWAATSGWISCPRNHVVSVADDYCPKCGAGPVPADVKWEAEQAAIRLGANAGMAYLRSLRPFA